MRDDLRFAIRVLCRFKLYTLAVTVTLTLGVGATAAIFSVIDATLLRPLPYRQAGRLVALSSAQVAADGSEQAFSLSQIELVTWRASSLFEGIEAVEPRTVSLTGSGEPEVVGTGAVTSGFFDALGVAPALGRTFSRNEERQNAAVAILSHTLWASRCSASASVLGQSIILGGRPYVVIGVMPQQLQLEFDRSIVWIPLNPVIDPARQNNRLMFSFGRLRPNVTTVQAQSELAALSAPLAKQFPLGHSRARPVVQSLQENLFGQRAPALLLLGAAVFGLLTLACANVANLTLGHLSNRQGELATRALVGAGAIRILRLLVVQTSLLVVVGGLLGLVCVGLFLPPLLTLYNGAGQAPVSLAIDLRVVSVSVLVMAATTVLCIALPAWKIHRASSRGETLRLAAVRFSTGRWEQGLRAALVSTQIGIAVALLCASGMLLKSLNAVLATPTGFAADRVLTMQMLLPPAIYPDASRASVVKLMLARVSQVPGVVAVGTTQSTFLPAQSMQTFMFVEGLHGDEPDRAHIRHITPGYFDALQVRVIEGRKIDDRDQLGTQPVCLVSEAFAEKYFPSGGALGHRVRRAGPTAVWMTIVGVVGDVRDDGLVNEPRPLLYVPYLQVNTPTARISLVARTQGDPTSIAPSIRQAIWDIDRNQPIDRIASLENVLLEGTSAERFRTLLVALFAAAGLVLAVVGVYAVTSASVTARTWEASLRLALGAAPWKVAASVLRQATTQIFIGAISGVVAFYLLRNLLASLLFETSAADTFVIAGAATVVIVLATVAAAWQSRRLANVSPALGLRGAEGPAK